MYRVALVAEHVIQYQAPFFQRLAAQPAIDLTVFFGNRAGAESYTDTEMQTTLRWDLDLLGGYNHVFLRDFGRGGNEGYARRINPGIVPAILRGRFDAVILFLGWGTITSLLAIAACRMANVPFLLYGDSAYPPAEDTVRAKLRAAYLRTLFGLASGFLVSGVRNAEYYRHYGADSRRFFLVPWASDNERFFAASAFGPGEREAMRARLGVRPDELLLVFSAKFLPRKDPLTLLKAMTLMRHRDRAAVLFLGHGELRESMLQFASEHRLHALFPGFINQAELPKHYAIGDVFVLSSLAEPRGTVVNEAMACGLPILSTDRSGAIGDIVQHGDNAFVFPAGDARALAERLDQLIDDPALRERMAERSRELIRSWSYERGIEGIREALRSIC